MFGNPLFIIWAFYHSAQRDASSVDGGRRISDFERQLAADTFLFLVTIEPTKRTALSTVRGLDRYGAHGRYTMLQSACSTHETPRTLTFYEHPDSQCNSLHPDNPLAVKVDAGKCVGGRSQSTSVPVVTLNQVLLRIPRVLSKADGLSRGPAPP